MKAADQEPTKKEWSFKKEVPSIPVSEAPKKKRLEPFGKDIPKELVDFRRDVEFRCPACEGTVRRYRAVRQALPEELRDLRDWRQRRRAVKYLQERARAGGDMPDIPRNKRLRSGAAIRTDFSDDDETDDEELGGYERGDYDTEDALEGSGELEEEGDDDDELYDEFDDGFDDGDEDDEEGNDGDEEEEEEDEDDEDRTEDDDAASESEASDNEDAASPDKSCFHKLRGYDAIRPTIPFQIVRFEDEDGFELEESLPFPKAGLSRYNSYLGHTHHHRHHHHHHRHHHPQVEAQVEVQDANASLSNQSASSTATEMEANSAMAEHFGSLSAKLGDTAAIKRNYDGESDS